MAATTMSARLPEGLDLPASWSDGAPSGPRYVAVAGSWAYGLNHADSDVDLRGFYVWPTERFLGLRTDARVWTRDDPDVCLHEVGQFCAMALSANPTVLETLASDWVVETSPLAEDLRANVDAFLSERVRQSHIGYARQQFKRVERRGDGTFSSDTAKRTAKHMRHMFRLIEQGERLLTTGELRVRVDDPDALRRYEQLPIDEVLAIADAELTRLEDIPSVLPDEPDWGRVDTLLRDHRLALLGAGR